MNVGPLYHWSPGTRFEAINEHGLLIGQEPVTHTDKYGYLCFAQDPETAWTLSAAILIEMEPMTVVRWDLWQIRVDDDDEMHPLPYYGAEMGEIRIHNDIPRSRIWHVGSRSWADKG